MWFGMVSNEGYNGLHLEYLCKDNLISEIIIENNEVYFINYTDNVIEKPFGCMTSVTFNEFKRFLAFRCFPRDRWNCRELIEYTDGEYDFIKIIGLTHGVLSDDYFWIRFKGEGIEWADIKDWHYHLEYREFTDTEKEILEFVDSLL